MTISTFDELSFAPARSGGVIARAFWPNGYGVSVICTPYSYGGESGLYELAVLAGTEADFDLTYDTPITSDVEGHLTTDAVTGLIQQVAALPPREASQ